MQLSREGYDIDCSVCHTRTSCNMEMVSPEKLEKIHKEHARSHGPGICDRDTMIMQIKAVMLADTVELDKLRYPLLASTKLDGFRAVVLLSPDGTPTFYSRSRKPIANRHVQSLVAQRWELVGMDGELIVGLSTAEDAFRVSSSALNSQDGEPDVCFHVFDRLPEEPGQTYSQRWLAPLKSHLPPWVRLVTQRIVNDEATLLALHQEHRNQGYEGTMLRDPQGPYKQGRSTPKQGYLLKLKDWCDSEAKVLELLEQMQNTNEATLSVSGHTERSSHKAGMVPKGTLGALLVQDIQTGVIFQVGTGLDDAIRAEVWANPEAYLGQMIRYKYMPVGVKEKPRFPVFQGFRSPDDMS